MRIHEHGNVIILLAASSALFAQSNDFPQNLSSAPIGQIVESSIAATLRILQGRVKYTYLERDESRRLDPEGRLKSQGGRRLENYSGQRRSI